MTVLPRVTRHGRAHVCCSAAPGLPAGPAPPRGWGTAGRARQARAPQRSATVRPDGRAAGAAARVHLSSAPRDRAGAFVLSVRWERRAGPARGHCGAAATRQGGRGPGDNGARAGRALAGHPGLAVCRAERLCRACAGREGLRRPLRAVTHSPAAAAAAATGPRSAPPRAVRAPAPRA